eukprot:6206177-Pleurochrysis_carterae.AAC.1
MERGCHRYDGVMSIRKQTHEKARGEPGARMRRLKSLQADETSSVAQQISSLLASGGKELSVASLPTEIGSQKEFVGNNRQCRSWSRRNAQYRPAIDLLSTDPTPQISQAVHMRYDLRANVRRARRRRARPVSALAQPHPCARASVHARRGDCALRTFQSTLNLCSETLPIWKWSSAEPSGTSWMFFTDARVARPLYSSVYVRSS